MKLRVVGSMMNPYEMRDLLKAQFHFSDETPEQVVERYKEKQTTRGRGKKGKTAPKAPSGKASKAAVDKVAELKERARRKREGETG